MFSLSAGSDDSDAEDETRPRLGREEDSPGSDSQLPGAGDAAASRGAAGRRRAGSSEKTARRRAGSGDREPEAEGGKDDSMDFDLDDIDRQLELALERKVRRVLRATRRVRFEASALLAVRFRVSAIGSAPLTLDSRCA